MPEKVLVAVATCHKYRARADAQRETWAKDIPEGMDVRFFLGGGQPERDDEIILPVDDGYNALPEKTRGICRWARTNGYQRLFKTDDDCYTQLNRLLASVPSAEYVGRKRGPSGIFPAPYCSGLGYWLGPAAIHIVAEAEMNGDTAEDRWIANVLLSRGINASHDGRYAVMSSMRNARSAQEGPRQGNQLITVCEFTPDAMKEVHRQWLEVPSGVRLPLIKTGKLSRVSILIKTFLRDGYLFRCIQGIEKNLPEAKMVIVDDGLEQGFKITRYQELRNAGHVCEWLPYDSGFGAKANAGIPHCDRDYVLIASDDFDFSQPFVREGIEKLAGVLDADPSIHIVSGRVNGRTYESCLERDGATVREIPTTREKRTINGIDYYLVDLTVNYSLIRRECLGPDKLHWDGDIKIGHGEHGGFFVDAKRLGYGVAVVPDAVIHEFEKDASMIHPMYPQARSRARLPGRTCLKRRGIDRWQLSDGTWDQC
jgi:hypothetical protein